jgi:hypothetical protein
MNKFLFVYLFVCVTAHINADNCCNNECVEFKDSKQFCSVTTNDLEVLSAGYLNNATVNSKRVIGDETVDGDITVLGNAEFNNGLVVNGEIIINGVPFIPGIQEFAYFAFADNNFAINPGELVPYDIDAESTSGITLNGDGSFTLAEAGIYAINFYVSIFDLDAAFNLFNVTTAAVIANTTFARSSAQDMPVIGFSIIQTTVPNTTIGVRSALSVPQTTSTQFVVGDTTAVVQIIRIG